MLLHCFTFKFHPFKAPTVLRKLYTYTLNTVYSSLICLSFQGVFLTEDTTPLGRVLNRFSQDIALMDLQMPRIFEFTMQHGSVVAMGIFGASVLVWPVIVLLVLVAFPLYRLQSRYNAATWLWWQVAPEKSRFYRNLKEIYIIMQYLGGCQEPVAVGE